MSDRERLADYWERRARQNAPEQAVGFLAGGLENRLYDRAHRHVARRHLLPAVEERLPGKGRVRVMEVGCGWGRWAHALESWIGEDRVRYLGIDVSEEMVRVARERAGPGTGEFRRLRATDLEMDGGWDVVFSFTVVQHLPYEDQGEVVTRMARALDPGGALVLVELLPDPGEARAGHVFPRTGRAWAELVAGTGLTVRSTEGVMFTRPVIVPWGRSRAGDLLNRITNRVKLRAYPMVEEISRRLPGLPGPSHVVVVGERIR